MTGVEIGLLVTLAGVVGVTGGKMWGIKAVKTEFLPRVEHDLGCKIVQGDFMTALRDMKEEIIQAIKENGACGQCEGQPKTD